MSRNRYLLTHSILNGQITGSELDALIAGGYGGTWKALLKSRDLSILLKNPTSLSALFASASAFSLLLDSEGAELAGSDAATETIVKTSGGILLIVTNTAYLDLWNDDPTNKARMQAWVNGTGSKLRRAVYTASDTWVAPGTPIVGESGFVLGGGGWGGTGNTGGGSAHGGGGGSGAGCVAGSRTTGLPTTNQTITVGGSGSSSSIASWLTGPAGATGPTGGGATAQGGGTDSGTIYDTDVQNALWQPTTASKRGGNGGAAFGSSGNFDGYAGAAGLTGSGGSAGTQNGSSCTQATGGSGLGSGGGSGAGLYPVGAGNANGTAASGYGCGGGGGSGTSSPSSGGAPTGGLVVHHWIDG